MTDSFHHLFKKGTGDTTFCLFHGTGGDENDLLPLAAMINPHASILSLRGNVNENGMNRFFKRLAEGIFDEDDIIFQSGKIASFLLNAEKRYGFSLKKTIFVGYSNGANIAASILLLHPQIVQHAILFRPMLPLTPSLPPDLENHSVLIMAGENDPIIPAENTTKLIEFFTSCKARVEAVWLSAGHGLTEADVQTAKEWYDNEYI